MGVDANGTIKLDWCTPEEGTLHLEAGFYQRSYKLDCVGCLELSAVV
jgi:hypothetical protein